MSKIREIVVEQYYHIYSRGINKKIIFFDYSDYLVFQKMIKIFNTDQKKKLSKKSISRPGRGGKKLVDIFCYTIMPNHFHFLLKELIPGGVSLFFQKILGQYANYFNKKYKRKGPLFESRFKNKLVDSDQYFQHLVRYIWNNPVKIINPSYKSIDLLNGKISLSNREKKFVREYPYKFFPKGLVVNYDQALLNSIDFI